MTDFNDKEIKQILNNDYSNHIYTDLELLNVEILKIVSHLFKEFPALCSLTLSAHPFHYQFNPQ